MRKKLERDPAAPEYLHTVRGVGYVFRPAPRANVTELDSVLAARDHHASAISAG
ncbi:MAG: helix-turn-helix domain-containing protein [Sphaerobacter thermophilus]|uniref:winged helix-turn-helix domain-containing protein n=1 Tax=Sphaerobacter thermophilus TaxID=2057 RepID=UPI00396EBAAE